MNLLRAVGIGIATYFVSFAAGLITAAAMQIDLSTATEAPPIVWYVGLVTGAFIMAMATIWYFRPFYLHPTPLDAFHFGLLVIAISFTLDFLLIIPYIYTTESPADPFQYYMNPLFWLSLVVMLCTASGMGWLLQRYGNKKHE